ncbi:hypothetical protein [Pseudoduganella armeniaca]|uniref:Ig-like domain-containing protein n=1 Tax=Pseudoduganella armeniaca TaxID=2072590 RepID=A0A2R4CAP1_9BURK|nr:hypothetical protein [Pseudoduganella armeniaca]AVR96632.1 hypothetical protein C9I28_13715 [Pseudoduganella armeniaca]
MISADLSDGVAVNDSWQVAVTDAAGKKATRSVSLDFTVPRLLATNLPATANVTATAESAGIATFTMASNTTGGTAPYTYSWVRAEGSRSTISDASVNKPSIAFPLTVGETIVEKWTVTVTDSVGYATSSTVAITAAYPATAMKLTFTPSSPRMDAADPGPVSVAVASVLTGGVPPYTYAWTPYNGTKTAVSDPAAAAVSIGATLAAGQTVTETWRLTVTDATAKTIANSVSVTLTAPAPLTAPLVATRSITASAASGGVAVTTLSVTPAGGRAPYTYQWQRTTGSRSTATNDTTANATFRFALNVGETLTENWSVTVADAAGHAVTSEVAITATYPATALALGFSPSSPRVDAPDAGPASVAVTGMPTGGIPPYTYAWTIASGTKTTVADRTAATATIAATLTAGQTLSESWRLTVTDTAGKSIAGTVTATLTAPAELVAKLPASYTMTANASSGGLAKAPVSVTVSGGRAPYSYSWARTSGSRSTVADASVASATISFQLNLGETVTENWTVTVLDAAGHTASATIPLTGTYPASALQVTFPATSVRNDAPNPGPASVTLSANVAGGIPPYTYAWARYTGSKTSTANPTVANPVVSANVAAGEMFSETWRLTVTDSAGKSAASNVTVTMSAPAPMSYPLPASSTASVGTVANAGVSSMQIGTSLTGGRTPYTYDWTRLSGSRSVASSETISNPLIKATLTVGETLTERWRVRITDSVGHVISAETDIAFTYPAPAISVSLQPASLSVVGNDAGAVTGTTKIVASGGIPPYTYGWVRTTGSRATIDNPASSTPVFSATLNAAESISEQWKATVTDSVGKSQAINFTTAFSVLAPFTAKATVSSENVTVTASNTTGKSTLSATATGGKSPYTYSWVRTAGGTGTISSATVANPVLSVTLAEGQTAIETWEVTVRDAVGHVSTATASVQFAYPYPKLVVTSSPTAVAQTVKVAGPSSVPVHVAVSGGLAPYTYNWQRTSGNGAQLTGSDADVNVSFNFVGPERTVDEWRVDVTDARGSKGSTLLRSTFAFLGIKQECTREDAAHFRCDVYNWTGAAQSQVHIGFDQSGLQVNPLNFYNCAANSYCGTYRVLLMPGSHSGTIYSMAGSYTSTGYTFNETVK